MLFGSIFNFGFKIEMLEAADNLDFERAAHLRDEIDKMKKEIERVF